MEIYINGNEIKAVGLIPSQAIRVHVNGKVYQITRYGQRCISNCKDEEGKILPQEEP
jgi:biotin synthase-related radical SAM superfamily protein